jgi:hypothetical protein
MFGATAARGAHSALLLLQQQEEAPMRIKLIFPGRRMRALEVRGKNHLIPSETLPALAAVTPRRHDVTIEDENVQRLHLDDQPDVVGITVYTFLAPRAYEIADHYRARGIPVVLGGLHVTGRPEEALEHADTIVVGEGDGVWPRLLDDLEAGRPDRLYRADAAGCLDDLPLPRKDLLDGSRYLSTASVSATRGCPHRCQYCFNSVEGASPFRKRSVPFIVRQVAALRDSGHPYVVFFDDNLTVDRPFARSLCEALGTPLFRRLEAEGRILSHDWSRYDTAHAVFRPAQMTPEELERGYAWIYREFYSWANIARRLPEGRLESKVRFVVFNLALKKANWLWVVLIRLRILRPLFRLYWVLLRLQSALPASSRGGGTPGRAATPLSGPLSVRASRT